MSTTPAQRVASEGDVEAWVATQQHKSLLHFLVYGSVDDGKNTLIGHLPHDTRQIYEDQLSPLYNDNKYHGTRGEKLGLALLVDGLQAECKQGITVDVAHRYFSTKKHEFIIADTPGHERYTRNVAIGASICSLAILSIDTHKGALGQTRRHSFVSTLLGIKHLVVAISKMDLMDFSKKIFDRICEDYLTPVGQLPSSLDTRFVSLSASEDGNVTLQSTGMPWYSDPMLLEMLEIIEIQCTIDAQPMRFPVQYVNRPNLDSRGYAGTLTSSNVKVGQRVRVLPSGVELNVARTVTFGDDLQEAHASEAIALMLEGEIDISRGDLLLDAGGTLPVVQSVAVDVVWMAEQPLLPGQDYSIKITGKKIHTHVDSVQHQADISNLTQRNTEVLPLNGTGLVNLTFDGPLALDTYQQNPVMGGLIIIDHLADATVDAGLVREPIVQELATAFQLSAFELELSVLVRRRFPRWGTRDLLGGE